MTQERAQFIYNRRGPFGSLPFAFPRAFEHKGGIIDPQGITKDEDREIKELWQTMPGYTCYMDAFLRFVKGEITQKSA